MDKQAQFTFDMLDRAITALDSDFEKMASFYKKAYTQAPPPGPAMADPNAMPPGGAPPPGDPNAMPPGGAPPPGDPNAMPPGGAPPPGDPNAMPPGGAPPMDPNAAPPPGDPNAMPPGGQGVSPEMEGAVSQLAMATEQVSTAVQETNDTVEQQSQRLLALEKELNDLRESLKGPAGFEGENAVGKLAKSQAHKAPSLPLPDPAAAEAGGEQEGPQIGAMA